MLIKDLVDHEASCKNIILLELSMLSLVLQSIFSSGFHTKNTTLKQTTTEISFNENWQSLQFSCGSFPNFGRKDFYVEHIFYVIIEDWR